MSMQYFFKFKILLMVEVPIIYMYKFLEALLHHTLFLLDLKGNIVVSLNIQFEFLK